MVGDNEDGGGGGAANPFGTSMTMEEIESAAADPAAGKADLTKVVAEGDDVPEAYRGKSFSEVIKIAETSRTMMNESTQAAKEAREAAQRAENAGGRQAAPPPPEPPKELSREELKTLYDEDPIRAIEVMQEQSMRRAEAHVAARIDGLTEGTMNQAEAWARQEFPDEFELFGDKIKGMVDSIPNKAVFTSKKGWQDAVSYIRGQAGNFEKLVDHRSNKANDEGRNNARERERGNAGFTGKNTSGNTRGRDVSNNEATKGMGDEERVIAQRFIDDGTFKDMAEYKKWQRMGG